MTVPPTDDHPPDRARAEKARDERSKGVKDWRDLTTDQVGDAFRGEVRTTGFRRVSHGLYRPATVDDEMAELVLDLKAWRLVLPRGSVFTHLTGARLRGWDLPRLPDYLPVFAAVRGDGPRPRRPGLLCSRLVGEQRVQFRHGLPVDSPEEILLRCARDLGELDLTIMINSATRLADIDAERMESLLASRRPGVRKLRQAWLRAHGKAESAGETVLGVFHEVCDIPVEPQVELFDDAGNLLGRADLLVVGTGHVHEYDGEHHRTGRQHAVDLRRERGLGAAYKRRGFVLDDLLNHPLTVMHELDRVLGRRHRHSRIHRWRLLVADSMYDDACRAQLTRRWQRLTGSVSWPVPA